MVCVLVSESLHREYNGVSASWLPSHHTVDNKPDQREPHLQGHGTYFQLEIVVQLFAQQFVRVAWQLSKTGRRL